MSSIDKRKKYGSRQGNYNDNKFVPFQSNLYEDVKVVAEPEEYNYGNTHKVRLFQGKKLDLFF